MADIYIEDHDPLPTPYQLTDLGIASRPSSGPDGREFNFGDLKRLTDGGQAAIGTDANVTLTVGTDDETQRHSGTLTADRTITLSTIGAYSGAKFHIYRTGGGAFNLDIDDGGASPPGTLKALVQDTWGIFVYTGSAWMICAYGAL